MNNKFVYLGCIAIVMLYSGCGFHLRGALQLTPDMGPVAITGLPPSNELVVELGRRLSAQNLSVTDTIGEAHTTINLNGEQVDRNATAIGADGRAREYRLTFAISFVASRDTGARIEPQTLSLYRDFAFLPGQVLAAGNEEASLLKDMQHEAAYSILRALEPLGGNTRQGNTK